jgi:hypothetical protein
MRLEGLYTRDVPTVAGESGTTIATEIYGTGAHNGLGKEGGCTSVRGWRVGPSCQCNVCTERTARVTAKWPHMLVPHLFTTRAHGVRLDIGPHLSARTITGWAARWK